MKLGIFFGLVVLCGIVASAHAGAPRARYDFDGDNKDDIATYDRPTGTWHILQSSTRVTRTQQWGDDRSTPVPGDYDGDGTTDIATFNKITGSWRILQSASGTTRTQLWGDPDSVPVPGDYDGDGKTDIAIFYRTSAEWLIKQSSDNATRSVVYGWGSARPVPADYDGDGKTDFATYLPGLLNWQILQSSNNQSRQVRFGGNGARPAVGYFDADNKADLATYTAETGTWQIQDSTTGKTRKVKLGKQKANSMPADYDGDGRTDMAVYTPNTGRWKISQTQNGLMRRETFGAESRRGVPGYHNGAIENQRIHSHGDSITYGSSSSSDSPATGYPIRLEQSLEGGYGGDFISLNYGIPGETTGDGVARLPGDLNRSDADVLLIMEGTNDQFFSVPFDEIENNLRQMVQTGLARGKFVVIATIPPCVPNGRRSAQHQRTVQFNPRIYDIAADYHIPVAQVFEFITAVPNWPTLLMDPVTENHPNDLGYSYVRAAFEAAVSPALVDGSLY